LTGRKAANRLKSLAIQPVEGGKGQRWRKEEKSEGIQPSR
jgi:hypothetical protein